MSDVAVDPDAAWFLGWLRDRRSVQVDTLSQFVGTDSQWVNPAGVDRLGAEVQRRLEGLGFVASSIPQPPVAAADRWVAELLAPGVDYETLAATRVARRDGSGPEPVLLLADLDTAFRGGSEGEVPFRLEEDRAFGTGVADMQGGLVVLLEALEALHARGSACPPLVIVLAGDEQAGSRGSRMAILDEAASCRWALCLECARDGGNLMASRAHIGVGSVEARGREAHAGTSRDTGISAIEALALVLPAIDALSDDDGVLVTTTMISGGRRRSVVPGEARAVLDLRTPDTEHWDGLVRRLHAVVDSSSHPAEIVLRAAAHRPGVPWTEATDDLLRMVREASAAMGIEPPGALGSSAAGSSAFAAEAGCVVLDGLGPPGRHLMTADEQISVSGIAERAALLAALITRLATPASAGAPPRPPSS